MDPPPAPPELRFRILGPLEVTRGGDALALGGPRQKAVLACLPVHANEVVPIDALADGIWEGRPPDSATGTIRTYVSHLRRVVEAGPAGGNGHVLLTTPPGYRLRVEPGQLDSDEFERLLEQARRARADGAPELALGHLNQALGLWRGPALADFAAESFAHAEAARLDGRRLAALEERIEAQLALGLHAELVAELEQRATDHPLRERLWGQLMLALYRSGRQAEALGAYQRTRAMLAEELGIDPGPALQRLQRAILQQDPALDWHPPSQPRSPALADPPAPESAPARRPGRSSSAASGSCATWPSCSGGPPTGRAAWCCWAARPGSARPAPPRSWPPSPGAEGCGSSGAAATRATAPPYWLWAEVLRSSVAGRDPEALAAALGGAAAEISQFVPELRERLPAPPPAAPLDPEAARFRLFEVVADLLRRAAAARPTLLVLDDLHWADKPSLMLLQFLTRQLRDAPVLVVGAYRDAEVGRRHPLNDVLASLSRERVTSRVTLQGLEAPEVARFIEAATGVPPGPLAAAVHARTEGNPFFVRELVRLLEAEGRLDAAEELGWSGVPSTVREVVGRARNRLSGGADHLLTHAAVIGRDFDAELLGRLLGAPDDQLVEVLEEVLASGLVAEDPGQVGGYRFSHDLVREAVYGELSTIRRAAMHRQIGQAIEDLRAACLDRHYAALARHFLLAARGGHDLPRAVDYAMLAADQATAALAYEEAIGHCERALRALRLAAPADHATACRLLLRLGDGRWRAGEVARARDTFLEAAALARSLEEPELLARAVIGFKGELFRDWHTTNGAVLQRLVELLEEALAAIGPDDGPLRVRLLGHLAEALCYTTADERRDALSQEAVETARRLDDPAVLGDALRSRCLALWSVQHLPERMRLAAAVLDLGQRLDSWELRLFGYHHLFVARLERGEVVEAGRLLDAFEEIADRLRQPIHLWQAKLFRTMQAQLRGAFQPAERLAMEALELGQRAQDPDALTLFATQIGLLRLEQGRLGEIEPLVRQFLDQDIPDPNWETARGFVAATLGRADEARREFERVVIDDGLRSLPRNFVWLAHLALLSESAAMLGHVEGAGILYRLMLPFADRNVLSADLQCWGAAARYLGILATTRGRLDDAERWLRRALAMNRRRGASPWVGHTLADLAAALLRRGRPDDLAAAQAHLDDALAIGRALEMPRLIERLQSVAAGRRGVTVGT